MFAAGDVMVSMRNLNTIAVLDGETLAVKWSMTGPFLRQHDPDFLPNGHICCSTTARAGRAQSSAHSRILEIDPVTKGWSGASRARADQPFYTDARGKQQALPNGNILVTEAQDGRVFELARAPDGGRVVAEWVNGMEGGVAGYVTQADRVPPDRLGFLDQPCRGGGGAAPPAGYAARPRLNCSSASLA